MSATTVLLIQMGLAVLTVLLGLAFLVGLAVAVRPALLPRLQGTTDRRMSMRRATRVLDIPRNVDRWFYRHHRLYGSVVVALSVALIGFLTFGSEPTAWTRAFGPQNREAAAILVDAARIVLWGLGIFTLIVGVIVFVRPSALKAFEAAANRWLTPRRALRGFEREFRGPSTWLERHPRGWGTIVALVSAACLLALVLHMGAVARMGG